MDFAADPKSATPKELYGEVAYKDFVNRVEPTGLLADNYNIIQRVREQKLLTIVADSGLLETCQKIINFAKVSSKFVDLAGNNIMFRKSNNVPVIIDPFYDIDSLKD